MRQSRHLILAVLFSLSWLVGMNHCALELLADSPSSDSADPMQSDCASHEQSNSNSHKEGAPCGITMISTQVVDIAAPVIVTSDLVPSFFKYLLSATPVVNKASFPRRDLKLHFLDPLLSLTIASNAPPIA